MSCQLQIVYPFAIKIKATYGNNIFTFCFRTVEDACPYKFWHMPFVLSMDGCAASPQLSIFNFSSSRYIKNASGGKSRPRRECAVPLGFITQML